ncbi:MAG: N-acetylmuramoyl-L-alanine amidase [Flammeovirgaceae bacterium]
MKYFCLFYLVLVVALQAPIHAQSKKNEIILCIDPGHGGKEPGKPSTRGMKLEKELNLAIAKLLGNYIDSLIDGVTVIYTRTEDTFVTLDERVNFANQKKADFFLSIHCNSNKNPQIYGTRTHVHSYDFDASRELAMRIEKEFGTRASRKSRGIMDASDRGHNLFVLQYTDMPAVLIEAGFMSNTKEERYLNSVYGQEILASAIFRAFRDFIQTEHLIGNRATVFKVQIGVANTPLKNIAHDKKFKKLGLRVVEHRAKGKYKYAYMVGREYTKAAATKLLNQIKQAGIKDAYIVSMTNAESKRHRILE